MISPSERVVIVGYAGRFPGANEDLDAFWADIISATDRSSDVPAGRWVLPPERCLDPRISYPDSVYSTRGYFLDPFAPDLTDLAIDDGLVHSLDRLFHLVLDVGNRAWRSTRSALVERRRASVILGNICLPTEAANALCREYLGSKLKLRVEPSRGVSPLNRYVAGLPAGVLATALGFGGGSLTLDAACASSLYALHLASQELMTGRADAVLAGGVNAADSQYTQMGFAQLRALSPSGRCSPFDARADGLMVGEGAGVFVLKRLSDALKHGDKIHAVLAGVGVSNDMHGNLLAPAKEGQLRAMRAAYQSAQWGPVDVDLIECHATGTPVGDAVEFDSLREAWGSSGWAPGQCVIGSVKSTVGHLLTGAGAAAVAKVLRAMTEEVLPPQANFGSPASGLDYSTAPFRILAEPERWSRRSSLEPRRAAVSGFGFGGVNAHLLLEEWTGLPAAKLQKRSGTITNLPRLTTTTTPAPKQPQPTAIPIAVVGIGAHLGPWTDLRQFQEHLFGNSEAAPLPKHNGWGLAATRSPTGYYIETIDFPTDRFRIPPKEVEETLPQQLLMLQTAAAALDDSTRDPSFDPTEPDPRTGVTIGLGLDPNTTNYHLRWSTLAGMPADRPVDARIPPPLTADRTMGSLGSIAASRIARAFQFGGPSHTVCNEDASSARAIERAVRTLQAGFIDRAVVGGVDLTGDPRSILPEPQPGVIRGEGAVAFVLKRLDDAARDGDRVYAVIRGVGVASGGNALADAMTRAEAEAGFRVGSVGLLDGPAMPSVDQDRRGPIVTGSVEEDVGEVGAATAAAGLAKVCLSLYQEMLPGRRSEPAGEVNQPRYWLHDRELGPRRAAVTSTGMDGTAFAVLIEEYAPNATPGTLSLDRRQPAGASPEALFLVFGNDAADLLAGLAHLGDFTATREGQGIEAIGRAWFAAAGKTGALAIGLVTRSSGELAEQIAFAETSLRANPTKPFPQDPRPHLRDRVFFNPKPLGPKAKVALVFPGSGNHFDGMGRELSVVWPEVLRRQHAENERLRTQIAPHLFWDGRTSEATPRDLLFGQVTLGTIVADLCGLLGIRTEAMIGLSLGESAGLFGIRAWRARDEMYRRVQSSSLFASDLAPPYLAARRHWGLAESEPLEWTTAVISASANDIHAALRPGLRAYLLIVDTPGECVIGGLREDVEKLAATIGKPTFPLAGVTLAHCAAALPVEMPYRELHTLPVTPPPGVTVFSGAWGRSYAVSDKIAAESITAGLLNPIDVTAVIGAAYRAGVRVFVEVGPGNSCTRMIGAILGDRPHLARSAHPGNTDVVSHILRLIAGLTAERVRVDLGALYGVETRCVGHRPPVAPSAHLIQIPVGIPWRDDIDPPPPEVSATEPEELLPEVQADRELVETQAVEPIPAPAVEHLPKETAPVEYPAYQHADIAHPNGSYPAEPEAPVEPLVTPIVAEDSDWSSPAMVIASACSARVANMAAQETFLRLNRSLTDTLAGVVRFQTRLLTEWIRVEGGDLLPISIPTSPPRSLDYEQCCAFAIGKIGDVLGPEFAEVDRFPTRVRLPDGPLQLVDRITRIEGEPRSMRRGRVVTEHAVRADRWYLDAGRIPTAIAVEAGQADLFLSGYLGIDFQTRGLAVYRLLDAVVTFHRGLPVVGETVVYDIRIDEFWKPGDSWLFRFHFDGTIDGQPFITMRNGVAGFFTAQALAAGKGIVQTPLDRQSQPGRKPTDWTDLTPPTSRSLDPVQVEALRRGDLAAAFGPAFDRLAIDQPYTLPGGMLRLVDRVPILDPAGGRFGLGFVRAEFDLSPDDWFLTCHFVDDRVMPGTLMYECCLHTLRTLLMSIGWVGEAGQVACEPVLGIESRLKCRGQVIPSNKMVAYEVTVKELGFSPEPYCIADALMYADGKPIVEITNMSLRMTGLSREILERTWSGGGMAAEEDGPKTKLVEPPVKPVRYDSASIMAFSNGNPSEAFGEPYRIFDRDRVIARLPGPPYQFLDRITETSGEPFVLKADAACVAEYDIPPDAWYFAEDRGERMPFSVLLEVALQPCGWLAAYCGSALTSPEDLSFRNLGGRATQRRAVTTTTGTLTTAVRLTNVSRSAGMIIQHYDMSVRDRTGLVYEGTTYFGFFSRQQLANQVGIREAQVPWPNGQDVSRGDRGKLPTEPPFPGPMMRMIDRIECYLPDGGTRQLGLAVGRIAVDPAFWFFKAHFYQDPVWPGSLGLESFLQLMKYAAWRRWGNPPAGWQSVALNRPHTWSYRGQVLPTDHAVTVLVEITAADDANRRLTANGFLTVDGRVIYQMTDFTLDC